MNNTIEPLELEILVMILSGIGSGTVVYWICFRILPFIVRTFPLPRWIHRVYAKLGGYFWLPCPMCGNGRMFGGHEAGEVHVRGEDGKNRVACNLHRGPAITITFDGAWFRA